jgi:hypothetical protein
MLAKKWLLLGGVTAVLGGGGCLHTCPKNPHDCLRPVEQVQVIAPARAKVYVFLMNGADLFDVGHLHELECSIVRAGFPKVYYAQRFDQEWYYKELHRLRREDPDNRFVLVGQGTAADQMQELACRVTNDGIPLDAVVFLDPVGGTGDLVEGAAYPSAVVRSRLWVGSPRLSTPYNLKIPEVGHARLPNHPATVDELIGILTDSARRVPIVRKPIDCIPLTDEPRPIPRPDVPKVVPPAPPNWDALCPNSSHR